MSFGALIRSFKNSPNLKVDLTNLSGQNNLLKQFFTRTSKISKTAIGDIPFDEFSKGIRNGTSSQTIIKSNKDFSVEASPSSPYIKSLNREATKFPEFKIRTSIDDPAATLRKNPDSNLDSITNADQLKAKADITPSLKKGIDDLEKKTLVPGETGPGGAKIFKMAAIIGIVTIAALTIYGAIEAFAKSRSGCFLYTVEEDGTMTGCKIIGASCYNKSLIDGVLACKIEEMPDFMKTISCDSSFGEACKDCSYDVPESADDVNSNQYLECRELSFTDALGELFKENQITQFFGGLSEKAGSLIKWILIAVAIIFVIWLVIFVIGKLPKNNKSQTQQYVEQSSAIPQLNSSSPPQYLQTDLNNSQILHPQVLNLAQEQLEVQNLSPALIQNLSNAEIINLAQKRKQFEQLNSISQIIPAAAPNNYPQQDLILSNLNEIKENLKNLELRNNLQDFERNVINNINKLFGNFNSSNLNNSIPAKESLRQKTTNDIKKIERILRA